MKSNRIIAMMCIATLMLTIMPFQALAQSSMVNVRQVFESMQSTVTFDGATKSIRIKRGEVQLILEVGSNVARKNGVTIIMDSPISVDSATKQAQISVFAVYPLAKDYRRERQYIVQAGDSLWLIAQKYRTTIDSIKRWNDLTSDTIFPGQHLYTIDPYHVVQSGETLYGIAIKRQTTVDDIIAANNLKSLQLSVGQRLYIPPESSVQPPAQLSDGLFPLVDRTYVPFSNDYGTERLFNSGAAPRVHEGIDIFASNWVPIFASYDGKVLRKGWSTLGGNRLTIRAGTEKIALYYAHLVAYAPGVAEGVTVKKGQLIGYVGSTGYGPEGTSGKFISHLHFGMYDTSTTTWTPINPYTYLKWWENQ
jgi:murein DD-endopeptidase MepM/ murein hydrolase activator NlpD